eukprot:scaffold53470_cov65-Phaeocystis_antarctica.AAC.1
MCVCKIWERRGGQGRSHKEACVCPAVRRARGLESVSDGTVKSFNPLPWPVTCGWSRIFRDLPRSPYASPRLSRPNWLARR